jgi:polysaccharide pyruvyl transferase WcaK-like protein
MAPVPIYSIIAATAYGNRGAQAMLETVVGRVRAERPDARFHVYTYYPKDDRRLMSGHGLALHSSTPASLVLWLFPLSLLFGLLRCIVGRRVYRLAPASIRGLAESVALVDLAGVSFIDGREKFLPFNVLTLLPAWLLGTPIVKLSQAVGPFNKPINRALARFMLPKCRMVWARGGQTRRFLEQSGFPGLTMAQADDIAFNHRDAYALTDEGGEALVAGLGRIAALRPDVRGVVGICPSSVVAVQSARQGGDYEAVLTDLITSLARDGLLVVLFPNATRAVDAVAQRNNDLPLLRRLRDASAGAALPAPVVFDFDINATGIKRVIAATDIVLVSRFHAMVGALSLGVPAAVLGWSHKYEEVMARFGLEGNVMDYKRLDRAALLERVSMVFDQRGRMRDSILEHLPAVKASADRPIAALLMPALGADLA